MSVKKTRLVNYFIVLIELITKVGPLMKKNDALAHAFAAFAGIELPK